MTRETSTTTSNEMDDDEISSLPPGTKVLSYREGNANVLLKIDAPESSSSSSGSLKNMLLRLRKEKRASTRSTKQAFRDFEIYIKPLFDPEDIVRQSLIKLLDDTVEQANQSLDANVHRSKKRKGTYAANDQYGLLVENIIPPSFDASGDARQVDFLEFKPKWLVQSPSAPEDAKRCRTCALREMRLHDSAIGRDHDRDRGSHDAVLPPVSSSTLDVRDVKKKAAPYFCPLDLLSYHLDDTMRVTRSICSGLPPVFKSIRGVRDESREIFLAGILSRNPLCLRLKELQEQLNTVSLDDFSDESHSKDASHTIRRGVSMTLRDCTVLVALKHTHINNLGFNADYRIKLCDLDFKDGSGGKLAYWRGIEERLISEGWYTGRRALCSSVDGSEEAMSMDSTRELRAASSSQDDDCYLVRHERRKGTMPPELP
ncbi:surf-like protein [Ascosphaera pollenicola]|nr:surf-like protein [Ascosphaera pollenicola]